MGRLFICHCTQTTRFLPNKEHLLFRDTERWNMSVFLLRNPHFELGRKVLVEEPALLPAPRVPGCGDGESSHQPKKDYAPSFFKHGCIRRTESAANRTHFVRYLTDLSRKNYSSLCLKHSRNGALVVIIQSFKQRLFLFKAKP